MENRKVTEEDFKRVKNDIYGNPRYVIHFLCLITDEEHTGVFKDYDFALKRAKELGGKKYRGKECGGGIVFQTYENLHDFSRKLNKLINE
jgi:hypothetical protein